MLEDDVNRLIKILEKSEIAELDVSTFWGKQRIRIKKTTENYNKNIEIKSDALENNKANQGIEYDKQREQSNFSERNMQRDDIAEVNENAKKEQLYIKAPLVGTFYRSTKPGTPPFIQEGDVVKVGQVVCIIEAMKIFNEIESEVSGKVQNILIDDSTPVEFDQNLFTVVSE